MSVVAIVAWRGDPLSRAVESALSSRGRASMWLEPGTLAGRRVTFDPRHLDVEGREVSAVLWRVRPDAHFSGDFVEEDRLFADVETRAFWLAALAGGVVKAPFCPDAPVFFTGGGWFLWRRWLRAAGVEVSPFAYGAAATDADWLPYQHGVTRPPLARPAASMLGAAALRRPIARRTLKVVDELVDVASGQVHGGGNAAAAADALTAVGVSLAGIDFDAGDAVVSVDPFPWLSESGDLVPRAASALAELLDAPADRR